jgi:hypothetical protein
MMAAVRMGTTIGRFFALVAVAGILLAPTARPAMAMGTPIAMVAAGGDDSATADAMDHMPCCPGKPSLPDCSKDCPLMALCVTAPLYFVSQTSLIAPLAIASIMLPGASPELASVAEAPPRRPPKA